MNNMFLKPPSKARKRKLIENIRTQSTDPGVRSII